MTNSSRFDAIKDEIRKLTPFIYVQTTEVHQWLTFLQEAGKKSRSAAWTFTVASTPPSAEDTLVIEQKLATYAKDIHSPDTKIFVLAHVRLTDQMVHTLKIVRLSRDASDDKWIPIVVVIHDEPLPYFYGEPMVSTCFPDFVVIKDEGPSPVERREHLKKIERHVKAGLPIDDLSELVAGMSFHQIDRMMSTAFVLSLKPLGRERQIPIEIFKLAAKDIVPAYGPPA